MKVFYKILAVIIFFVLLISALFLSAALAGLFTVFAAMFWEDIFRVDLNESVWWGLVLIYFCFIFFILSKLTKKYCLETLFFKVGLNSKLHIEKHYSENIKRAFMSILLVLTYFGAILFNWFIAQSLVYFSCIISKFIFNVELNRSIFLILALLYFFVIGFFIANKMKPGKLNRIFDILLSL